MAAQRVVGAHRQTQADVILGERTVRDAPDDVCRSGMRCLHQAGGCAGGLNEQRDRTGLMLGRDRTGRDRTGEDRTGQRDHIDEESEPANRPAQMPSSSPEGVI